MTGRADPFDAACDLAQYADFAGGDTNAGRLRSMSRVTARVVRDALTQRQRELVVRHYFEGVPVSRLARELGCCPSTVSRTLARARSRVQRVLRYWLSDRPEQ